MGILSTKRLQQILYCEANWNTVIAETLERLGYKLFSNGYVTDNFDSSIQEGNVVTIDASGKLIPAYPDGSHIGVVELIVEGNAIVKAIGEATVISKESYTLDSLMKIVYVSDVGVVSVTDDYNSIADKRNILGRCVDIVSSNKIKVALRCYGKYLPYEPKKKIATMKLFATGGTKSESIPIKFSAEINSDGSISPINSIVNENTGIDSYSVIGNELTINFSNIFSTSPYIMASHWHSTPSIISNEVNTNNLIVRLYDLAGNPIDWTSSSSPAKIFLIGYGN